MRPAFLVPLVAVVGCSAQPPQIAKTLPPPTFETWAPQELVTNVQDWDRVATKIADGLQAEGLLRSPSMVSDSASTGVVVLDQTLIGARPRGRAFSATYDHNSMFSQQVVSALEHEVYRRGGAIGDMQVDLNVSIVPWGSRLDSQPYTPRREGVWQATVRIDNNPPRSFREPFYVLNSDVGLYVQLPAPPPSPDQVLAGTARPLSYTTK